MLVIYVPPSELTRFGAGMSATGDILVIAEEIEEVWIARNCSMHMDQQGEKRWAVTRPFK